ncbi:MAG TPA: DUF2378 family protein [Blastocatellia bacterium]|nr:DUF2378 family protein [Blastocatellia bacterium]
MKIKGNILLSRLAFVKEHFGEEALDRVIESLPAEDRATLRGMISNVGWYSFDIGKRLDEAIVKVLGKGDMKIFEDIGASSAEQNLTTVHNLFLKLGNPQAFLAQTPVLYRLYYDIGRREYEPTGPTSGVMTTYDAETYSTADCLTVIGWYKKALAMCGAKNVVMTEETCRARGGDFCRYRISWQMDS